MMRASFDHGGMASLAFPHLLKFVKNRETVRLCEGARPTDSLGLGKACIRHVIQCGKVLATGRAKWYF